MFGESRSESPRLPSPWRQALATTRNISIASESPLQRESPQLDPTTTIASSYSSRAPSCLSLRAVRAVDQDPGVSSPVRSRSDSAGSISSRMEESGDNDSGELESWRHSSQNIIISPDEHGMTKLTAERDAVGHIEYKLKLIAPAPDRFDRLTTQLKWRLTEGGGEAMYEIGVLDDGTLVGISKAEMEASLKTLESMAAELGATVMVLRTITILTPVASPGLHPRFGTGVVQSNTLFPREVSGVLDQGEVLATGTYGSSQTKQRKKQQKRMRLAERKDQSTKTEHDSHVMSAHERKKFGIKNGRPLYDDVDDSDEACTEPTFVPSDFKLGKQADVAPEEEATDSGASIAESWRARNIERARHELEWRSNGHTRENHPSINDLVEMDFEPRPERKWKGKRPWRRKQGSENESSIAFGDAADDDFLFNLEVLDAEPEPTGQPLTHAALRALQESSFLGSPPPKKPFNSLQHNRQKKSSRKEERRLELLRGDGVAEGAVVFNNDSSDSESDLAVKNLLHRMILSPRALSTDMSPQRTNVDEVFTQPATSPSGKTLRAPSPRLGTLFSLTGPRLDPAMQPSPSPTDTITQPLDSLSLSFAHSEVVPQNGATPEDGPGPQNPTLLVSNGEPDFHHICVEALVIKKMDADEPFGFLDFGSVGLDS